MIFQRGIEHCLQNRGYNVIYSSLSTRGPMLSGPGALCKPRPDNNRAIPLLVIVISHNLELEDTG